MTLQANSVASLMTLQTSRLRKRLEAGQIRRSRSQYTGRINGYDADQGVALVNIPTGGTIQTKSITTSASQRVAVSISQRSNVGNSDAKPITNN